MKKRFIFIIINLLFINSFAQTNNKIFVADSISGEPIEYACIIFIGIDGGTYSNDKGFFYIPQNIEQIELSSVGYYSKKIALDKNIGTIFLSPQIYEISEAKVMPAKKKRKSVELGYAKEKEISKHLKGFNVAEEIAVYISIDNEDNTLRLIKQVIIKGKTIHLNSDETDFKTVFKINFYRATENKEIGEFINTEDIVFIGDILKNNTKLDVSKYNTYMPENGIFVALEYVGIINSKTGNFAISNYKDLLYPVGKRNSKIGPTRMNSRTGSLPFVKVTYKVPNSIVFEKRRFRNAGNWQKVDKDYEWVKSAKELYKDLKEDEYYTPLISIVLE